MINIHLRGGPHDGQTVAISGLSHLPRVVQVNGVHYRRFTNTIVYYHDEDAMGPAGITANQAHRITLDVIDRDFDAMMKFSDGNNALVANVKKELTRIARSLR